METRSSRDRIVAEILKDLEFYRNQGAYNVVNIAKPGASNPDLIKELFSSKSGIMKKLAGCKGLGSSEFEKLYKRINTKRKELTSTENLSKHYYEIVAKISGATEFDIDKIKLCEKMINNIEKDVKKFIKTVERKYIPEDFVINSCMSAGIGAVVGGILLGSLAFFPFALMPPIMFPSAILGAAVGAGIGAAIGLGVGGGMSAVEKKHDIESTKSFFKNLKDELKRNKNKNLDYKLSPRTVFLELDTRIGVLASPKIVVFEPQNEIKKFYEEYKAAISILNNELERLNLEIFKPQFNNSKKYMTKEMRKIIKNTQDYSNFIEYVKSECTRYLSKKEKSMPKDEKKQKSEDKAKIAFAKFCTKLTYTPLKQDEIKGAIERAHDYVLTTKMSSNYKKVNNLIIESQEISDESIPSTLKIQFVDQGKLRTETTKTETVEVILPKAYSA